VESCSVSCPRVSRVSVDAYLFGSGRIAISSIGERCSVFNGSLCIVGGESASTRLLSSFEEVVVTSSYSAYNDMVR
jgi:hypothetical protein